MKIFAAAELAAVNPLRGNSCITRLEFFPLLCLPRDLLEIHARQVRYYTPPCLERSDGNRPNLDTALAATAAAATAMPEPPANDQSQAVMEPNPNDDTMEFDELSGRTLSHPGPWKQMLSERREAKQQAFSTNTQPAPGNLRPISLTSCVGKLLEHMVQNRLSPYIEDNGHFPTTMYGFRPHLSTQDVLLQLKEEIIDRLTSTHKRCIVALDIKGAFDNISHQAILQGLTSIDCGQRTYDYITAFLTGRTATIGIGHLRSNTFKTISKGTPQGSVISPLLFNIAMKDLPPLLQNIPHLRHAIYADDLTLWTPTGSMGGHTPRIDGNGTSGRIASVNLERVSDCQTHQQLRSLRQTAPGKKLRSDVAGVPLEITHS
ncbi:hypothetical protein ISCGN_023132 [Ixodes scapularis]